MGRHEVIQGQYQKVMGTNPSPPGAGGRCFGNPSFFTATQTEYSRGSPVTASQPVGTRLPSGLGLFDMSGNVWEWCWDCWEGQSSRGAATDPRGPTYGGTEKVYRGGSWAALSAGCRSAYRTATNTGGRFNGIGFRVLRIVP